MGFVAPLILIFLFALAAAKSAKAAFGIYFAGLIFYSLSFYGNYKACTMSGESFADENGVFILITVIASLVFLKLIISRIIKLDNATEVKEKMD